MLLGSNVPTSCARQPFGGLLAPCMAAALLLLLPPPADASACSAGLLLLPAGPPRCVPLLLLLPLSMIGSSQLVLGVLGCASGAAAEPAGAASVASTDVATATTAASGDIAGFSTTAASALQLPSSPLAAPELPSALAGSGSLLLPGCPAALAACWLEPACSVTDTALLLMLLLLLLTLLLLLLLLLQS
jgi:hypothetical protein